MEQRNAKRSRAGFVSALGSLGFVLLCSLTAFLMALWFWQRRNWDDIKLIEIYSQLKLSIGGTGEGLMRSFWMECGVPTALALVGSGLTVCFLRNKSIWKQFLRWGTGLTGVLLVATLVYAGLKLDLPGFLRDLHTDSAYIEENYVDPAQVELQAPPVKRNLIYIWLESMESTYADREHGGAFSRDVIPELTELARENISFSGENGGVNGGISTYGTTWTMGGLFAQMTGLPLKIPVTDNSMRFQEHFFSGVTALGDLLDRAGYTQTLMIGSKSEFGGRRLFFQEHGAYEILDYPYAISAGWIPEGYRVWWGYEDEKLFDFARQRLLELAQSDLPFNFSLLTVDTHFPDGYVCARCPAAWADDNYSRVMACSSRQVQEFVQWIQSMPFYENTTIVLCGDHITMNVDYCNDVDPGYQRKTYTAIINPAVEPAAADRARVYTTMDLFPTTLAALGFKIPGERLGLGTNLFSTVDTLVERDGLERLNRELAQNSELMNRLSDFDESVFRLSRELADAELRLEVQQNDETLDLTLWGLEDYADHLQKVEIFSEKIDGLTRLTILQSVCEARDDGSFTVRIDRSALSAYDAYVFNVYVSSEQGRIKAGSGWDYQISTNRCIPRSAEIS